MENSFPREQRYSRNILLEGIGQAGQQKISKSRILVIGAGGLGSAALFYLAAAGVGTIGIADGDAVDLSNLQRQVIHFTEDVGKPKAESAAEKIARLNPHVCVRTYTDFINADTIADRIRNYDFIIDGTDSFAAKFMINDACVAAGSPYCHAGVLGYIGQLMTVVPGAACLRCVLPEPPPAASVQGSSQVGILGALAGMAGCLQAAEAVKYIAGTGELLTNSLLLCDLSVMSFQKMKIKRRPQCRACKNICD